MVLCLVLAVAARAGVFVVLVVACSGASCRVLARDEAVSAEDLLKEALERWNAGSDDTASELVRGMVLRWSIWTGGAYASCASTILHVVSPTVSIRVSPVFP